MEIQTDATISLSSYNNALYPNTNCIDGKKDTICKTTGGESHPWIALQFPMSVDFTKVVIINRQDRCGERMKNMRLTATDNLPVSSSHFSGGNLFAYFQGHSSTGRTEEFTGSASGSVLVIQMRNTPYINLADIKVYGEYSEGRDY